MPDITCPECKNSAYYRNIEGKNIKGKCTKCGIEITIPYKSASGTEYIQHEKCKKCGHMNEILFIPSKTTPYIQTGYRGGSVKMFHRTREIIQKDNCTNCGAKL